jgi:hypothetical protein
MQWFSGRVYRQNIASMRVMAKILVLFELAVGLASDREIGGSEEAIADARGHGFLWFFHGALVVRWWTLSAKGRRSFSPQAALDLISLLIVANWI